MNLHKVWLLRLVLPVQYGRVWTGLLLATLLLTLFYAGAAESSEHRPPALFFGLIIAYIIPIFSYITAKAQEAMRALRPILALDDTGFEYMYARLDSASLRLTLVCLGGGALAECMHLAFISRSWSAAVAKAVASVSDLLTVVGTLMVWVVMTTVIAMLIQQAVIFGRLGGTYARVSLLDTRKLLPFARVSIISSLAIIGALALFPLINLEGGLDLAESVPGAVAILGPLIVMFIIPVWPLHQRLVALKNQEMLRLLDRIEAVTGNDGSVDLDAGELDALLPLLTYRREVAQLSTWPFNLGNITTLAFYLVIPPLTWVGGSAD